MNRKPLRKLLRYLLLILTIMGVPLHAQADPGDNYCIVPPFVNTSMLPNLLLLMDNSASMYDLSYADKGTATRTPTYCYDNTYSDANSNQYAGYFDVASYYDFDIASGYFNKIATFPASGSCSYYVANKYCIATDNATPKRVTKFSASGNYLNWLTASKFDVQKKILTGGKYEGGKLLAESRGCVGRGFIKQPLSSNSGNYVEGGTNTAIPVTLQIKGAHTSFDEAAPSQGGQTSIYFYYGSTPYNSALCKTAIDSFTTTNSMNNEVRDQILACIGATSATDLAGKKKQIFQQSLQECWQYYNNTPNEMQGNDFYNTVSNFCTSVYNLRDQNHGPLPFNPASDIAVGDADLLCSATYVGACYTGVRNVAMLEQPNSPSLLDFLLPRSAYAAPPSGGNFQFSSATYSVAESGGSATLTINRSGACNGAATVTWATSDGTAVAGSDYTATTGSVSFANNSCAPKTITVPVTNDAAAEVDETFNVTLTGTNTGALGSIKTSIMTILDNDGAPPAGSIALSSGAYTVNEAAGTVTVTVNRTGGSAPGAGVSYATSNGTGLAGTNYTTTSGTLSFGANESAKTFTVPIINAASASDKTFTVTLSNATGGATLGNPSSATVTITFNPGNGTIVLSSAAYSVSESVSPITVTVKRLGGSSGAIGVNYATSNGSALSGTNYTSASGTLSWNNGESADKSFTIPIIDANETANKEFQVTLSVATGGASLGTPSSATVTISYSGATPGPGTWSSSWTSNACIKEKHEAYCSQLSIPPVTDPTDAPGNTATYANLPAVIADMGIEGQLGAPLKLLSGSTILDALPVKLATSEPAGLLQAFSEKIRVGLMSFNYNGSPSECAAGTSVPCPKVCSNDAAKTCGSYLDCCQNSNECSCDATSASSTNVDGAKLLYPVGKGTCSNDASVACATNDNCTLLLSSGTCEMAGTGGHGSGLVQQIDSLKAANWTPFSEAFYDAIGYYARVAAKTSRTALRINPVDPSNGAHPVDFPADMNPSQYICQQNYVLLISDGVATADQRPAVSNLAALYKTNAGLTGGNCADAKGSSNLPILSWLAQNRDISDFSTSDAADSAAPAKMREKISTYVVFAGQDNGAAGECNSVTMMSNTATKGGGRFYRAENARDLEDGLRSAFQEIAARAASGTAASILSNSEGSGANILQAVFYPRKVFGSSSEVKWIGEMLNLWYYVDPMINNSTIREDTSDTEADKKLHLVNDYVARFAFDPDSDRTMVRRYQDTDGDGDGDTAIGGLIDPDDVKAIWRAGKLLWARNIDTSPRTIKTTLDGISLINFSSDTRPGGSVADKSGVLYPYLNVTEAEAPDLINFVHGEDHDNYRKRKVWARNPATNAIEEHEWRLGDIISSTPRVQSTVRLGTYNLPAPGGYSDSSYQSFVGSNEYQDRGMVYVGANDGMLHAFKLGLLSVRANGLERATLKSEGDLGQEKWAYIPRSFLPYLKYTADKEYKHLYAVDGRTVLLDASIGDNNTDTCLKASYWECNKPTNQKVTDAGNDLDATKNTWRTVVIGGMGLGGASSKTAGADKVATPRTDPADADLGLGYSSYFALDVSTPNVPALLWEFNDPALGYATSGPAIVRVGPRDKNGRWFAVFGSGPTGWIDTDATSRQFKALSNQTLKFFVVDLRNGTLVKTIDTGIADAFAGSMIGGSIDSDRWNPNVAGNYQDDAIYVGFVKKATSGADAGTWTDGGVIRIMTKESINPNDATNPWSWSKVIDGIGPVTASIARLQDKKNRNLWLFSGTGRYFYRDDAELDDYSGLRMLFGLKDPCYNKGNIGNYLDKGCSDTIGTALVNQTDTVSTVGAGNPGWKIVLDASTSEMGAERVVTDPVALTNGTVFLTTFKPAKDLCGFGGDSYLWGVKYDTGGEAPANALTGKALIQLSTGEFKEVDLATAFTDKGNRRMLSPMTGKPPSDAPPIVSNSSNRPVKKILHIREH